MHNDKGGLACCWCLIKRSHSYPELAYNLQILPSNGKQVLVADETFRTLLTNEKQEKVKANYKKSELEKKT
jgi:hypothetical protein